MLIVEGTSQIAEKPLERTSAVVADENHVECRGTKTKEKTSCVDGLHGVGSPGGGTEMMGAYLSVAI